MTMTTDGKRPVYDSWSFLKNLDNSDWATSDINVLKSRYEEMLKKYPSSQVKVIHEVDITLDFNIKGCPEPAEPPKEEPGDEAEEPKEGADDAGGDN